MSISTSRTGVALAVALTSLLFAPAVVAQSDTGTKASSSAPPSVEDKAAADALFDTALKMMEQGNYADACEKLQKSHALDPAVGTLLNLGRCYRERGQTASAWTTYREAAALARQGGQADREKLARDEAQALEARLVRVHLLISDQVKSLPGLTIQQNGQPISLALAGEALPVNPGLQTFQLTAEGQSGMFSVEAKKEGETYSLNIEKLDQTDGDEPPSPQPAPADNVDSSQANGQSQEQQRRNYVGPIVLGAAGIAGVTVGTVFALVAKGHDSNAREICKSLVQPCTQDDVNEWNEELSSAKSSATIAYIGWGVGGAAIVGSVVWFLLDSPSSKDPSEMAMTPILTDKFWGVSARGSF